MQEIVTKLILELQQNIADNAGIIDYDRYEADLLSVLQNLQQCNVMRSLPPLPDIELALNMAQAELRYCYRTLGYKKSNVIMKVDEVLEAVQAAMPS